MAKRDNEKIDVLKDRTNELTAAEKRNIEKKWADRLNSISHLDDEKAWDNCTTYVSSQNLKIGDIIILYPPKQISMYSKSSLSGKESYQIAEVGSKMKLTVVGIEFGVDEKRPNEPPVRVKTNKFTIIFRHGEGVMVEEKPNVQKQ